MKHHPLLLRFAFFGTLALTIMPLASAWAFRAGQVQTREPPLIGQPPPKVLQPPTPVPVVPAPYSLPQQGSMPPGFVQPPMMPAPVTIVEIACPPADPPAPLVKIRVRVAACSPEGQQIEYHITVENASPAPAHHVLVRNPVPANCRFVRANPEPASLDAEVVWALGTLNPGDCREIVLVLAPTDSCDVMNCARVQFEHGQCVVTRIAKAPPGAVEAPMITPLPGKEPPTSKEPPLGKEPPKVITPDSGKISLKITGPRQQYANLPVKYQITVVNTDDKAAENLVITAFLPDKGVFIEASDNGRFQNSEVAWLLPNLPPGAAKTLQVTYRVAAAGESCLKVTALIAGQHRGQDNFCTKFEGVSALLLETKDTKDPVEVGGQTSYRIVVFNQGTASLTNVRIEVLVPREFKLVRAKGATSPPKEQDLSPPTKEGQLVLFQPLAELKPGEQQVYEVFGKAMMSGDARWRTVVTVDQLTGGPVMEEESTTIFRDDEPGLSVSRWKAKG